MSDRVFALLVRLYPAAFRRKYQQEALQLYRDRLRDERGLVRRIALYRDLLLDAAVGVPLAWRNSYGEATSARIAADASGMPTFHMLEREPLKPGSVIVGCVFSIMALVAFGLVMRLPAPHRFSNGNQALSPVEAVLDRINRVVSAPTGEAGNGDTTTVNGQSSQAPASSRAESRKTTGTDERLTERQQEQVIQGVSKNLAAHYFDRQRSEAAVEKLRALKKQGAYAEIADAPALAERLTADIRNVTGDMHLNVAYSRSVIQNAAPARPSTADILQYRAMLARENCSIEVAEVLPGNIGYLKFNAFPEMSVCGASLRKAIAQVNSTRAVIFDLRDNTGGFPETVAQVAAPLFDHTVAWYTPRNARSATTLHPVPSSTLAKIPVYILTSSRTLSGAEQFTYDLKMLKRATIVGETTGGGGHVGTFHRVNEHFGIGIPETKIANPYGKPDWDGVGVEPDVKVKAANALDTAEKMAAKQIQR